MTQSRKFYPSLVDVNETERKLRDLNGEFGPKIDEIRNRL
jgi:hypothetical protein